MSANHGITVNYEPPTVLAAWRMRSLIAGVVFAVAGIIGFIISTPQALHAYLSAYMLILGLTLGSMAWLMVWHLTGGSWGVPIRRILEAAIAVLPLLVIAWIPIVIGSHSIYPWTHPDTRMVEELSHAGAKGWLTTGGFILRGIGYFIVWGIFAWFLLHFSHEQDRPPERAFGPQFRAISGIGLVVYAWTLTFAVVDWVMSLTPGWTSTIYGLIFMVGQAMVAMCFVVIVSHWLRAFEPMAGLIRPHDYHDYGKLMLTTVMLWAYFSFSQWLIIWGGNLPEEAKWFYPRLHGGWGYVSFALIIGQFAFPFCLLLSRSLKRNSGQLFWVAVWLVIFRYVELYWNVEPSLHPDEIHYSWLDLVMPVALVGLWLAYFFFNLARRPLIAVYDPHTPVFLESEHD